MIRKVVGLTITAAVLTVSGFAPTVQGEEKIPSEYVLKAAFLYNFAKFVEWPEDTFPDGERVIGICVLGEDPFGHTLESIEGKIVKGRRVMIKLAESVADAKDCHVLFISRFHEKELVGILADLKHASVLTVGDGADFGERGGIIHFITVGNKLRFNINLEAAQRSGLKISSKLLKLANRVSH
ncbi:MAG: YfiR family protein [Thermodesulfobacteriota bacterium]|nr:YfiR family protein [Thermodesulfobacteriota bacterium]